MIDSDVRLFLVILIYLLLCLIYLPTSYAFWVIAGNTLNTKEILRIYQTDQRIYPYHIRWVICLSQWFIMLYLWLYLLLLLLLNTLYIYQIFPIVFLWSCCPVINEMIILLFNSIMKHFFCVLYNYPYICISYININMINGYVIHIKIQGHVWYFVSSYIYNIIFPFPLAYFEWNAFLPPPWNSSLFMSYAEYSVKLYPWT